MFIFCIHVFADLPEENQKAQDGSLEGSDKENVLNKNNKVITSRFIDSSTAPAISHCYNALLYANYFLGFLQREGYDKLL